MQEFLHGTELLFTNPIGITIFVGGLIGGLVFGAIPGLNVLTLAAVLLPFTAWFPAEHAIMLYGVIYVSGIYGGAITAILFNIPGAPENAPTAFDGYPMTQKGMAGKAVGAAVLCSAIGGVASALVMMSATEPLAKWAIMNIGPPEDFSVDDFYRTAARAMNWEGNFRHNLSKPTGMAQKLASIKLQDKWGWRPNTDLELGIKKTYEHYCSLFGN